MKKFKLWLKYDANIFISKSTCIDNLWPFTIDVGVFARRRTEVLFIVADKVYAINGRARMNKKYIDFIESKIWKSDSEGNKISVAWIIEKGLVL